MKTGVAGRELIERNEGLRLNAYQDSVGVWTIGFGDTGPDVVEGLTITREEADQRFSRRLAREFEPAVDRVCEGVPTKQGEFDAMVSLAYNIGTGAFAKSSVARMHRAGNTQAAAEAFALWNKAGGRVLAGLTRRRQEEADLYVSDAALDEEAPEVVPEPAAAEPLPVSMTMGHQKAIGGTLAVQGTMLFDKAQAVFTGFHLEIDTIMLIASIAVGLVVWKLRHGGEQKG